jgi:hypothetical protein
MSTIRRTLLGLVTLALAVPSLPTKATAWGPDGQEVVVLIAEQFLTPVAKQRLDELLQLDNDPLTAKDISSRAKWADRYRDLDRNSTKAQYNATQKWHYVNIEIGGPDIDADGLGAKAGPSPDVVLGFFIEI